MCERLVRGMLRKKETGRQRTHETVRSDGPARNGKSAKHLEDRKMRRTYRNAEMPNPRYSFVTPPAESRRKIAQGRSYGASARAFRCSFALTRSIG